MKKVSKIIISVVFAFILILVCNHVNAASDFELEKLDFQATISLDGDMKVTETWQVDINGTTNTLFKTFKIDESKYSKITNVKVYEVYNGSKHEFAQSNTWKNHVDTNYYHALNYKNNFEIAWGVNKSSGTHTYIIEYSVEDVISVYADCAELYWQFIGEDFEESIDKVTGTITLPSKVKSIDNLRVWGHGELNGEISRDDEQTVKFTMEPYYSGTYLEIRIAILEPKMFVGITKTSNKEMLQTIISEETKWAEEANEKRERAIKTQETIRLIATAVSIIIGVAFIPLIIMNFKKIKETPKTEPTQKLTYFRDIPNESRTPSEVGFLYYYRKSTLDTVMPKILSATMLDLALKNYIEFEINEKLSKKEQVTIKIVENKEDNLKDSERIIYELFKTIAKYNNRFNMKEFEKYARKNNTTFLSKLNRIKSLAKEEQEEAQNYNKKTEEKHDNWNTIGTVTLILTSLTACFALAALNINIISIALATILAVIYAMTCFNIAGRYSGLTQKGLDEQQQWQGLKQYMEEFSMIKDREVPELVLWEKYLVYATVFGNAEKVLKQLKVVYPDFSNSDLNNTTYFYLIAHTDFNNSFVRTVNSSIQSAYSASMNSSGGGYGGGFSSGGGHRRRRWPVAADDKSKKNRVKMRKIEQKLSDVAKIKAQKAIILAILL